MILKVPFLVEVKQKDIKDWKNIIDHASTNITAQALNKVCGFNSY